MIAHEELYEEPFIWETQPAVVIRNASATM